MGYHVAIIRTSGEENDSITLAELQDHSARNSDWTLETTESHPSYTYTGATPLTCWLTDGELWTTNPDEEGLKIMLGLASDLGARVRGDEFETYNDDLTTYNHPDDVKAKGQAAESGEELMRKARKRQWKLNLSIASFFIVIALIASRCSG